ncbi:MAG: hypothetical protein LBN39_04585 [Planctomycetaceae bacterium]|jgi:hypothetical protein|nr:hypothetical protein [Planctomycetaceae bacterium]
MKTIYSFVLSAAVLFIPGCDISKLAEPAGGGSGKKGGGVSMTEAITGISIAQEMEGGTVGAPSAPQPQPGTEPAAEAKSEESKPETELVKADVGAGRKGHYGQKGGEDATDIITVPVATLFRAKEMTAFRIQVPQALQLYKATNDGKGPETDEEFQEKIIKANNIVLPELPEGQKYVYDPKSEQLMVEKPR